MANLRSEIKIDDDIHVIIERYCISWKKNNRMSREFESIIFRQKKVETCS